MTTGQWHRLLTHLWEVCLAVPRSGEGCRCKLEYILYSGSFPPWSSLDHVFLTFFSAFNILLPHLLSERLNVMQVYNSCITLCGDRREFFFFFFAFDVEFWTCTPCERFLDISCSRFTPRISDLYIYFFSFLSCGMHQPEHRGEVEGVCRQLSIRQRKEQVLILHKPRSHWHMSHSSEEVKVLQLCKNLNVTTDKMSNNGGTALRGTVVLLWS